MAADSKSSARLTCTLTLTELSQELGEGDGGVVVGLVRIATKVIQGFIYLKLNYLSSGAPKTKREGFRIKSNSCEVVVVGGNKEQQKRNKTKKTWKIKSAIRRNSLQRKNHDSLWLIGRPTH